jgi:hypothetical protein
VFYTDANPQFVDANVHDVYWTPGVGIQADQWTFDGQVGVGSRLATLLSG